MNTFLEYSRLASRHIASRTPHIAFVAGTTLLALLLFGCGSGDAESADLVAESDCSADTSTYGDALISGPPSVNVITQRCACSVEHSCCPVDDRRAAREVCVDTTTDPAHCGACGNECSSGELCVDGQCRRVSDSGVDGYRYVRILDRTTPCEEIDSGADIDAVILEKADGRTVYARNVIRYANGAGFIQQSGLDPTTALGPPDAFYDWPSTDVCADAPEDAISLNGGLLIVELSEAVEPGDALTVVEVGGCSTPSGTPSESETIDVAVSESYWLDGTWSKVGSGSGPRVTVGGDDIP